MPSLQTARGELFYADHRQADSDATPVLFVHGAGASHLDWPPELRRLPEANAIAPDLLGHGKSPGPGRRSIADYAADMVALLDALHLPRAIIAGHSMGGAIAQQMALDHAERVQGLVLIGTGAKLIVNDMILNGIRENPAETAALISRWAWAKDTPDAIRQQSTQRLLATDPDVTYGDYLACNGFHVVQRLSQITAPTLVIGGTADKMTPFKLSEALAQAIPNARLVPIANGGHMMMLEQPQTVAQALQAWLSADR